MPCMLACQVMSGRASESGSLNFGNGTDPFDSIDDVRQSPVPQSICCERATALDLHCGVAALRPAGWVVASLLSGVGGKMILLCSLAANRSVTTRATTTMVRIGKTEQNRKPQFHSDPLLLCFAARPTDRTDSTDRDDRVGMIKTHSRSESEQIESRAVRATAKHSSGTNAMPEFREKRER